MTVDIRAIDQNYSVGWGCTFPFKSDAQSQGLLGLTALLSEVAGGSYSQEKPCIISSCATCASPGSEGPSDCYSRPTVITSHFDFCNVPQMGFMKTSQKLQLVQNPTRGSNIYALIFTNDNFAI